MMRRSVTRSDPTSGELSPAKTATLGRFGTGRHASVASPAARPGHHEVEPSSLTKAQQSRRQRITLLALTTRRGACFDSSIVAFAIAESIVGDLLCPELLSFCVHVARGLSAYLGMYVQYAVLHLAPNSSRYQSTSRYRQRGRGSWHSVALSSLAALCPALLHPSCSACHLRGSGVWLTLQSRAVTLEPIRSNYRSPAALLLRYSTDTDAPSQRTNHLHACECCVCREGTFHKPSRAQLATALAVHADCIAYPYTSAWFW